MLRARVPEKPGNSVLVTRNTSLVFWWAEKPRNTFVILGGKEPRKPRNTSCVLVGGQMRPVDQETEKVCV